MKLHDEVKREVVVARLNASSVVLWTAVLTLSLAGCGGGGGADPPTHNDAAGRSQPLLINAPLDPDHKFDVGICKGPLVPEGEPFAGTCNGYQCSGTLIAPNVVLTARHCVSEIDFHADICDSRFAGSLAPEPTVITTSSSVWVGTPKWYQVTREHFPTEDRLCAGDIALLILAERIPAREARPAGVNLRRNFATRPPGSVAIVGRGVIDWVLNLETFESTYVVGDLERRVLENISFDCATDNPAAPCVLVDYWSPPSNSRASPPAYLVRHTSTANDHR
jgi:Trypsin